MTAGIPGGGLDADAKLHVLNLVTCVGVEVVGGSARELVAATELAADHEAETEDAGAGGDPAEDDGRGCTRGRLGGHLRETMPEMSSRSVPKKRNFRRDVMASMIAQVEDGWPRGTRERS